MNPEASNTVLIPKASELYKDTYLTYEDYLKLYKGRPYKGTRESIFGSVSKLIMDQDNVRLFKKQVKNGLDINRRHEGTFYNLVHCATIFQAKKILTYLVEQGAELKGGYLLPNGQIYTAVFRAVQESENTKILDILIKGGAPVNVPQGSCVFRAATRKPDLLEYLLKNTEGPNLSSLKDSTHPSDTIIYWLLARQNNDMFKLMLEGFIRKPLPEAAQLMDLTEQQIQSIIALKPNDTPFPALTHATQTKAKQALAQFQQLFDAVRDKYKLDKMVGCIDQLTNNLPDKLEQTDKLQKSHHIHKI